MRLEDLPPAHRAQAQKKLAAERGQAPAPDPGPAPAPAKRSQPREIEHGEQVVFVRWLELCLPEMFDLATAVPHGGHRTKATAGKLKAEGVSGGYPDILIDLPRGRYHGLRIEMKKRDAPPSATSREQLAWHDRLRHAGYHVAVAYGADEACQIAQEYWELGEFHWADEGQAAVERWVVQTYGS